MKFIFSVATTATVIIGLQFSASAFDCTGDNCGMPGGGTGRGGTSTNQTGRGGSLVQSFQQSISFNPPKDGIPDNTTGGASRWRKLYEQPVV